LAAAYHIARGAPDFALVLLFWIHVMSQVGTDFSALQWWIINTGLTFNVLVGNLIYLGLYISYERYRRIQERSDIPFGSVHGWL